MSSSLYRSGNETCQPLTDTYFSFKWQIKSLWMAQCSFISPFVMISFSKCENYAQQNNYHENYWPDRTSCATIISILFVWLWKLNGIEYRLITRGMPLYGDHSLFVVRWKCVKSVYSVQCTFNSRCSISQLLDSDRS